MTSSQESSNDRSSPSGSSSFSAIECLGGVFHPHAIEVQEFSTYGLVIDVRSRAEFDDDHIPGAIQLDPTTDRAPALGTGSDAQANAGPTALQAHDGAAIGEVPAALGAHLAGLGRDQAVLVYCGQGGRDSLPVARALRWRGWTVDLLAGGWINYRRWVQAGLELLPRLVPLRVVGTALGCESRRVLQALAAAGHQIIDLHDLARWRPGALTSVEHQQPAQAWFESQLLQQLRQLNSQQPVWVSAVDRSMGTVVLPGALADAMDAAPTAIVEADPQVRMQCWRTDEPDWDQPVQSIVAGLGLQTPAPSLATRLPSLAADDRGGLMELLLREHFDPALRTRLAVAVARPNTLPPLTVTSYEPAALADAIRSWPAAALR